MHLLKALYPKLDESKEVFDSQHIGNILYGIQHVDTKFNSYRKILYVIKRKLNESIELSDDSIFMDHQTKRIVEIYTEKLRIPNASGLQEVYAALQEYLLISKLKASGKY